MIKSGMPFLKIRPPLVTVADRITVVLYRWLI